MNKLLFYLLLFSIITLSCSDDEEPNESVTFTTKTSTTEIQFGSIDIPNTEEEVFSLTNTGTGTITITNVSIPNGFKVTPTNSTLQGGETQDFTVVFSPDEAIIYDGYLSITSNSTSIDFTVFLSGTGVTQKIATYYDDVEPIITPNCVNTAGCHSNSDKKGGVDLSSYLTVKTDFQDTSIHGSMHQITSGQMPLGSDKLTDGEIALLQNWIDNDFQEGTPPTTTFTTKTSTTEIQFGSIDIPNTEEEVFSLTNTGTGTITITNVSTPNGFTVTPTNSTLLGGEIQDFTVVFSPTEAIIYNGHLSITSNSTSINFTVLLSGTGVTRPTITSYTNDIQPIVASSCATSACHDKTKPKGGLNLTDYEKVKSSFGQNGNSWARINSDNNPMPASGKLPQIQIDKIKDWIDNGFIQ